MNKILNYVVFSLSSFVLLWCSMFNSKLKPVEQKIDNAYNEKVWKDFFV